MSVSIKFPLPFGTKRTKTLYVAALVTIAVLGCTSRGNARHDDEGDDRRPSAATQPGRAIAPPAGQFSSSGKVGVWTKADSRTLFGDLRPSPLGLP